MTILSENPGTTIRHPFHPEHELSLVTTGGSGFRCNGCKQFGEGSKHYRCEPCDLDLHVHCATAPAMLKLRDLFAGSNFLLCAEHEPKDGNMLCHGCGVETVGFRYHSPDLGVYLHPCCAFLPMRVVQGERTFELHGDNASHRCGMCRHKSKCLCYSTNYDDGEHVYLHVPCLVSSHNAMTGDNKWQASAPIREDVLETFERSKNTVQTVLEATAVALGIIGIGVKALKLDELFDE
ncbi:unnamed protein product [Alopecurus aequalis]